LHVYGIANNLNSSRSQAFTYDQLNRILSAGTAATTGTYCWGYQYSYDAWGNLLSQAGWSPTYNSCTETTMGAVTANGNNQITGLSYDASGNTLSDGTYTYTWDGESQMKTAAGVTYAYDGDGRRAAKVGNKLYWYGSGGEILSETDAAGNTLNEYIFFGGKRVAVVPAAGSALYYAEDLLGSSRVMVQSNGTLCYDADFTPFGAEKSYTSTCPQNYKFEGKERDAETGNDDFGARYYTWRFGRWLSSDWSAAPVAVPYANLNNPQTLNLYSMVADDPESFADLDGHASNGTTTSATCGNTGPANAWGCVSDSGGELIAGGLHSDREDASLARDAANAAAANEAYDRAHNNTSSSGGGFWSRLGHGLSNLFHGHSWNYVKTSVTVTQTDQYGNTLVDTRPSSPAATVGLITGVVGTAVGGKPGAVMGLVSAGESEVLDHSPGNSFLNLLGLIPEEAPSSAIMGIFVWGFDYGINNSHPGPQKVGDPTAPLELQPALLQQDLCPPGMGPC
jgi:RHS repeat-associated protein